MEYRALRDYAIELPGHIEEPFLCLRDCMSPETKDRPLAFQKSRRESLQRFSAVSQRIIDERAPPFHRREDQRQQAPLEFLCARRLIRDSAG